MKRFYNQEYFEVRDLLSINVAETIKNLAKSKKVKRILDVGCGTGLLVKYMNGRGFEAKGCDNSKIAVKKALLLNKKNIFLASATSLPFKKNSFDMITGISVVEHLNEKQVDKFLEEAIRVLCPNGSIFMVTPNYFAILKFIQGKNWFGYKDPTHINFYTPQKMSKVLKKHGFNNIHFAFKCKYHPSFDWEFPSLYSKLPRFLKVILIYLLFSTPLLIIRNSFWVYAQKNDEEKP